jgi:hypothetical protein
VGDHRGVWEKASSAWVPLVEAIER